MPVFQSREWIARGPENRIREALAGAIWDEGGEVLGDDPFRGKIGDSWQTRLVGGWFVPEKALPLEVSVSIEPYQDVFRIQANATDGLGFGARWGMVGKLTRRLDVFISVLVAATGDATASQRLTDLKRLANESILTPEEYEAKRAKLVDEL